MVKAYMIKLEPEIVFISLGTFRAQPKNSLVKFDW